MKKEAYCWHAHVGEATERKKKNNNNNTGLHCYGVKTAEKIRFIVLKEWATACLGDIGLKWRLRGHGGNWRSGGFLLESFRRWNLLVWPGFKGARFLVYILLLKRTFTVGGKKIQIQIKKKIQKCTYCMLLTYCIIKVDKTPLNSSRRR